MATTTLSAIMQRFQTVLEGDPLNLALSPDAFSLDVVPNSVLKDTYHLLDGGIEDQRPLGNYKAARIDRLIVMLARKAAFKGQAASEAMQDLFNTVERYLKADGPGNNYRAELLSREVSMPEDTDVIVGALEFFVDYDYDEATS